MRAVNLRIEGGRLELGPDGLALSPWFTRHAVRIPWSNVMFVSPVPAVKRTDTGWRTFRDEEMTASTLGKAVKFYSFEIALNDRHEVLASATFLLRVWLASHILLKPLFTAEDTPHPTNGWITVRFPRRWVRKNGDVLLRALDMVEEYSRFDLLCHTD